MSDMPSGESVQRAREITDRHRRRVYELIRAFSDELISRGLAHDMSKYEPEELIPLARMQDLIDREGHAQYGTAEYKRRTDLLGDMTAHHYAANSHHPEHYENGISGMDLLDLVEMFLDWKAASERGGDSVLRLIPARDKYQISPQLSHILRNTADRLGFATDS